MVDFEFDNTKNSIAAISFGPDSMALLGMLLEKNIRPVVCHVNYHTRKESNYEEEALKEFCEHNGLIFECLDASKIKKEGNFEAWARQIRYMFFKQMYVKYHAQALFIGHQQDDLLETYLLQKDRNSVVKRYGLGKITTLNGMKVIRPLLIYTKEDLLEYCHEHHLPYSIDVSNFDKKIQRNRIRHEILSKMSEAEREQLLGDISNENKEMEDFEESLNEKIEIGEELEIRYLLSFDEREFSQIVRRFVNQNAGIFKLSAGQIKAVRDMCLSPQPNSQIPLDDRFSIVKEYDVLIIGDKEAYAEPYEFVLEKPGKLETEHICVDFSEGAEDRHIFLSSYPIKIRSPKPNDEAIVGGNLCTVRRLFIDWKMPARLRKVWPVVEDKNGMVVYVPRYRKNYLEESHTSIFKIKF